MMKNYEKIWKICKNLQNFEHGHKNKKNGWKSNRLICNNVIFNIELMHQLLINRAIILTILRAAFALWTP